MIARVITAAVLAALAYAALFYLSNFQLGLVLLPLLWFASREWARLSGAAKRAAYAVPALMVLFGAALLYLPLYLSLYAPFNLPITAILVPAAGAFWLLYTAALVLTLGSRVYPGGAWGGGLLILAAYAALLWLHAASVKMTFAVLVMIWAADIGAFFVGRGLGGPRLARRVSPGKTWSGFVGGILIGLGAGALCASLLLHMSQQALINLAPAAALALLAAVAGDLAVSVLKRRAHVKDSGRLLPGHGGLLDRLDSSLAALPVVVLLV